jgi:DNA-binding XRE family transcriptional regulator
MIRAGDRQMPFTQEFMRLLKAGHSMLAGVDNPELALRAGISEHMLGRIERVQPVPSNALDQVQVALERMGIMFFPSGEARCLCVARRKTAAEKARQVAGSEIERPLMVRAARALLGKTQEQLGKGLGLSRKSINRVEAGAIKGELADKVVASLEKLGVLFIAATDEHWSGVGLRRE